MPKAIASGSATMPTVRPAETSRESMRVLYVFSDCRKTGEKRASGMCVRNSLTCVLKLIWTNSGQGGESVSTGGNLPIETK